MYKLLKNPMTEKIDVVQKQDGNHVVCIPFDPDNRDYQEYLKWLAEGNTPQEADNVTN